MRRPRTIPNPRLSELTLAMNDQKVRRVRVTATRLARRADDYIFAMAELEIFSGEQNVAQGATVHAADSIEAPIRWGTSNLVDGKWPRASSAEVERQIATATAARDHILAHIITEQIGEQRDMLATQSAEISAELEQLPAQQKVYAAATSFEPQANFIPTKGKPREVFVLIRGEVGMPGKPAVPGVLPVSGDSQWQFDSNLSESERRAQFAQWLTDRQQSARMAIDRQSCLAISLWRRNCRYPQRLRTHGCRADSSRTARLVSGRIPRRRPGIEGSVIKIAASTDCDQQHLSAVCGEYPEQCGYLTAAINSCGATNRRRLTAEELRDSILTVSGAMNWQMGGPGYYLFELEKPEHSPHFEYFKFDPSDPASHRRSIYRFVARSQPNPYMTTLDCADSSQSTPRRSETLTSLQALALLNNKFNLVMAR